MLAPASTTVRELRIVNGSMTPAADSHELARIGDPAAYRAGGCGERTCEQRARAAPLAALEVAVAGADGVLAASDHIAVHAETHGAARFAPLGAGLEKHAVEPFRFRLSLDLLRAGYHQHTQSRRDAPAPQQARGAAQVGQACIGAAAEGHHVHGLIADRLTGHEAHVSERLGECR